MGFYFHKMFVEARPTTSITPDLSRAGFSPVASLQIIPEALIMEEKPQEECGVTGIYSKKGEGVIHLISPMQSELQHRGQDAAGRAVFYRKNRTIEIDKGKGLVHEVFPAGPSMTRVDGISNAGIGHNRYGTDQAGGNRASEDATQPMKAAWEDPETGEVWEMAVSFNGNLPTSEREKLRGRMPREWREETFDTLEIDRAIVSAPGKTWEDKIRNGLVGIDLAYSLTLLTGDGRLFGLRAPSGVWPLWVGETSDHILLSSESRVDKATIGGERVFSDVQWSEVLPGELVEATPNGVERKQLFNSEGLFRCSLHDMYGARADSLMSQDKAYGDFRREIGRTLAKEHPVYEAVYMGLPESGLAFADGYAEEMGAKADHIVTKKNNQRSYIASTAEGLGAIINGKYVIEAEARKKIDGKRVVVTEDSVIKGTTLGGGVTPEGVVIHGAIELLREAGAREVHIRTALPPFVEGCDLGYVIDSGKLVALQRMPDGTVRKRTNKEIADALGADSFAAISRDGIQDAYEKTTGQREIACMACQGDSHPGDILEDRRMFHEIALMENIPEDVRQLALV